ncbi:MAG: galactokinase [Candidatus Aminicenantaceae bacterium]
MNECQLIRKFEEVFHSTPELISSAPGRINIIGEHTDYNLGYVLPAAIHMRIYFIAGRRDDDLVRIWADDFGEERFFSSRNIVTSLAHHWETYIKGIFWVLENNGFFPGGINGLVCGDIPIGSGLSSSAALEVSVINGLDMLFQFGIAPMQMAKLAQQAENDFVGMKCGLMDQFISVFGKENMAFFLDCLSLDFKQIPLRLHRDNLTFLVYDSCVKRELSRSEYNRRRSESSAAERYLKSSGIPGFRGATQDMIQGLREQMDKVLYRRSRHVLSENERVQLAIKALYNDDFLALGQLLFQSHESLRDDYEVSCPELDLLYEFGMEFSGCLGSRLTGAGFGGSGIALVKTNKTDLFTREILDLALKKGYRKPRVFPVRIDKGATTSIL